MKLEPGQVAVVTGAANGIGFALCEQFAKAGLHVVMSDVDHDSLTVSAGRLADAPGRVLGVRTDVTSPEDVGRLAERTLAEFGRVLAPGDTFELGQPRSREFANETANDCRYVVVVTRKSTV